MFNAKCGRHWTSSPDSGTPCGWMGNRELGRIRDPANSPVRKNVLRTLNNP